MIQQTKGANVWSYTGYSLEYQEVVFFQKNVYVGTIFFLTS